MNRFEFDNLKDTPRSGLGKICRWLALAVLLTSTDLAALPWWAARVQHSVQAARKNAADANVEANSAAIASAQAKAIDAGTSGEWASVYNSFGMTGSTPVK